MPVSCASRPSWAVSSGQRPVRLFGIRRGVVGIVDAVQVDPGDHAIQFLGRQPQVLVFRRPRRAEFLDQPAGVRAPGVGRLDLGRPGTDALDVALAPQFVVGRVEAQRAIGGQVQFPPAGVP